MTGEPSLAQSADVVRRVADREFPTATLEALAILEEYGTEDWHRQIHRVRLGILRLAARELKQLRVWTTAACTDYRDVLMGAEYPHDDDGSEARRRDADEYSAWLEGD